MVKVEVEIEVLYMAVEAGSEIGEEENIVAW